MSALNLSWLDDDASDREMFADEAWPPENRVNPTKMYVGTWPPPESAEHAGTGSADDDWPPRDPDDLVAGADPDDDAWGLPAAKHPKQLKHPKHQRAEAVELGPEWQETAPAPAPPPKPQPSEPMKSLQRVIDTSTDEQVRMLRARGCDLMPKRWNGAEPSVTTQPTGEDARGEGDRRADSGADEEGDCHRV